MNQYLTEEQILDVAQISAIISNHICDKLYDKQNNGYMECTYTISKWSLEFFETYKDFDWELLYYSVDNPFSTQVICYDDAIVWFANEKLNSF